MRRIDWSKIRWGTLTRWLKKNRAVIARKHGNPFTKDGRMNVKVIRRLARDKQLLKRLSKSHWRRIQRKLLFRANVIEAARK